MFTLSAIDIGTNTVRLLVVESDNPNSYRPIYQEQEIARLGEGFNEHGQLQPQAMERTLKLLARFARKSDRLKANEVYAVATSAVREAENGAHFIKRAKQQTGIEIDIIPAQQEARLALLGVQSVIHLQDKPILVIDIGGGSTEIIQAHGNEITDVHCLRMVAVKLTEAFLKSDPVDPAEYQQMRAYIDQTLGSLPQLAANNPLLVGIAGTSTTLAAVDQCLFPYDPQKINNYVLTRKRMQAIQDRFLQQTLNERRLTPGLEPERADVIVAGTALLLYFIEKFGFNELTACDSGLREGVVFDRLKHHFAGYAEIAEGGRS